MGIQEQILPLFCGRLRRAFEYAEIDYENLREIRIRAYQPITLLENKGKRVLNQGMIRPELKEIGEIVEAACGYSGYAFEEELKRGYVTISGGHRIGVVGQAVMNGSQIQTLKYISAVNIRVAHSVTGCGKLWEKYFYQNGRPCHVLIISPPGCGKTTLLRDVIRIYSQGCGQYPAVTVGVVDERSEIAGTYRGIATHDLGIHTDVLDSCPKHLGMEMLLRSMAPEVLAVDEIGEADVPALESALRCGCKILATLHSRNLHEFLEKPGFTALVKKQVFDRYLFLTTGENPGEVQGIYGKNFERLEEVQVCT